MSPKLKKALKISVTAVTTAILIFVLTVLAVVLIARINKKTPSLFGYSFHVVVTGSMTPEINVGDMVIAKKTDNADILVGDDIIFISRDPALNNMPIVHRVKDIVDGEFVTTGIKEGLEQDKYTVVEPIGKVVAVSAFWGKVFSFLLGGKNVIFALLVITLLAIAAVEAVSLFKKSKKDKYGK